MPQRILSQLPEIAGLRKLCQSLAMLDAIIEPAWDLRYFSFNSKWAGGEEMASMRDGSGDDYFILFNRAGAIIKGYAHESIFAGHFVEQGRAWPGVLEAVPTDFADFFTEPAFEAEAATFCFWRKTSDTAWQVGPVDFPSSPDPDGADDLLFALDPKPRIYHSWAEEYHGIELPLDSIEAVYAHQPLTQQIVHRLKPDRTLDALAEDIAEINYPS